MLNAALIAAIMTQAAAEPDATELRFCGIASMQCMLRSHGIPLPAGDIERRAVELYPSISLSSMSLAELKGVLCSYGMECKAGEVDVKRLRAVPTPSILYIAPSLPERIGHYVFLRGVTDSEAQIEDWTLAEPYYSIPLEQLMNTWGGVGLYIDRGSRPIAFAVPAVAAVCLAVSILSFVSLRRISRKSNDAARHATCGTLVAIFGLLATGCNENAPPLTCGKPVTELPPMVQGVDAQGCFKVSAWGTGSVTITGLKKSCECVTSADGDLVGKVIDRGASETICLHVPTHGRAGLVQGSVVLLTDPPQQNPITLVVRTQVESKPSLASSTPLLLRSDSPSTPPSSSLRIAVSRLPDSPPLKLDREASALQGLVVVDETLHSSDVQPSGSLYEVNISEVLEVTLQSPVANGEGGGGVAILRLAGRPDAVEVPYKVVPSHLLALELDSLYVHSIAPRARKDFNIAFRKAEELHLDGEVALTCSAEWMDASTSESGDSLLLSVVAPPNEGRYDGTLMLDYIGRSGQYEERLTFPVTVNVKTP